MKNRIKLCALFLIFVLVLWETAITQGTITSQQKELSGDGQNGAFLIHTNFSTVQEACTPEQMGNYSSYVGVSHAFYGRAFKSRNVFGRLLCVLFMLFCLGGMAFVFSISRYRYFQKDTNLAMLIAFIHAQDGKKSH